NAVTNSGAIWAGVFSDVLVDISVDIPDYPMPDPEEMPEAMFLGVGDEVKDVYGVAINGNHALTNSVLNSGAIWAGVFADADSAVTVTVNGVLAYTGEIYGYVGDEAKDIYGVAIDGHGAGTGAEDIVLTEDDPVLTGGVFGNTVANSGTIMAGVSHTAVPGDCSGGDVEDVYGIAVDGDWAGVGADILIDASEDGNTAYSITNFLFGNEVMNSGTVTAGAMDSFIGDDVEDIYGISIDGEDAGRWADGSAMLDAGTVEDPTTVALSGIVFGNSIVNSGPVTAGVTDSEVGGNVEDVYGIAVDGDDAGKRAEGCASTSEALTNANTLTVSDVLFGNQVINSGTLLSGVEDSEVGCSVEDVYGIFIKGDEAGAWPEGSADLEGEPAIALTDVLFGNRVVNSGPVTAGVVNSVVWGDCCHGGDVKDIYGIAIEGHEAGQGGTTDVNGFDVVFGNLVENSGTVMAGVFTDATVDGLDVTYIANEGTELVDVVADDMTGGISYVANDVEDVYGVSIDGDNALTNTVSNSGADTIMAGVFTNLTITNITIAEVEPNGIAEPIFPYVGDKVKDVYGVYIDGDQWSCGDVTNTVTNDGAIEAGIFTNVTAGISNSDLEDGPFPEGFWIGGVGDDVRDIYGVYISGNGAEANTVTNDGTITSGIFTDMTVDGEQTPGYVGDDVKHIAGVYISGEASDNLVENSGTITAGVTNTEVAGDVKGVYGVYILGTVAASGANVVENSGTIAAGIESSIVGDDVKHIYGVKIRGDGAELNQVNNDGTITAAVTNTDVADSVEDVYGVYISGVGADSNVVNNSGTIVGDTGIAVVGDADIENSGAVTGTGGTAILLGPGTNLVTLLENSVITGDIDGTTHGGNDTLVLDSDRGFGPDNLIRDQINADQIKGFEDFAKTGPGLWGIGAGENDLAIANSLTITEGTLAIGGNVTAPDYTQTAAGATLGLIVTDDGSAGTLTATNSATLDAVTGSPVLVIPQAGIYGGTTDYGTVIDFDPVVAVNPANLVGFIDEDITSTTVFLIPTLTREDDHYNLTLTESWGVFGEYGSVFESLLPGAPADVQNVIFGLSAAEGKALSEQLGGLIYPNLQGAALSGLSQYFGTLTGRMGGFLVGSTGSTAPTAVMGSMLAMNPDMTMSDAGRNLILAAAAQTARQQAPQEYKTDWGFWSQVYGGWGENDGSNIASMYDYDTRGISLGFDKKFGRNLLFGVAFGYSYTKVEMDTLSNEVEIDGFHGSLYGTINFDPWYLKGILSYERSDYESTRNITLLGLVANGDYSGDIFSGYLEAGYIYKLDKTLDIIPMVSIQGSDVSTDGFTETGAGAFNLHVSDDSDSSIVSTVGLKVRKVFTTATGTRVIPEFGARWAHEFSSDEYTMNANFPGSTGSAFAVKGEGPAENAALLGVGLTTDFTNNLSLYLIYDLSLSDDLTEHRGTVGLRYTW
ncbi:MAG: autotransporter domain-containing protein, partial [Deltaproteobacteria bacterium]|nr:autotransporter domain-containing protein [Deltaproteobacteria bacterium]